MRCEGRDGTRQVYPEVPWSLRSPGIWATTLEHLEIHEYVIAIPECLQVEYNYHATTDHHSKCETQPIFDLGLTNHWAR